VDICVCIFIALIVLYCISRQLEIVRRSQYHVVHKSSEQGVEIEKERERADWLLINILPEHVIEPLRQRGAYSRNHPCVGVLFASLINFHVMYEEQYEGGKFYARILNEFYGDIEELFLDPRFSKIEKIKTIGATFMAASGLQTDENDQNPLRKNEFSFLFFMKTKSYCCFFLCRIGLRSCRICFSISINNESI
jgi:adenylate cyclase 9